MIEGGSYPLEFEELSTEIIILFHAIFCVVSHWTLSQTIISQVENSACPQMFLLLKTTLSNKSVLFLRMCPVFELCVINVEHIVYINV